MTRSTFQFKFTAIFIPQFTKYVPDVTCIWTTNSKLLIHQIIFDLQNKICSMKVKAVAPILYTSVSQTFLLVDPFRLRKITTDPHDLDHINIVFG
jgi:hypothetical protein